MYVAHTSPPRPICMWLILARLYLEGRGRGQHACIPLQQARLREGKLYERNYSISLLKCLINDEANYVMREIHEGVSGNHASWSKIPMLQDY